MTFWRGAKIEGCGWGFFLFLSLSPLYRTPIDASWPYAGLAQLRVSLDEKVPLLLEFPAEAFRSDSSGSVVATLKLADAAEAAELIERLRS